MNFTSIIDNARAYGKVRELKIKMDESNIKDLCDIDPDFCEYAIEKEESFDTTIGETMVIEFIKLLKDKTLNLNDICEIMMTKYKKNIHDCEWIIQVIINSYNKFYLNNDYYYNGQWYDGNWYYYDQDFETQDKMYNELFYNKEM